MKTVLVTGGTRRLGLAISARLRMAGWRVLTSSHRPDAGADLIADLSTPDGAATLYSAALRMLGGEPPDALVNNAALFTGEATAIRAVDLEAPVKLTMLMAGRESGVGSVVNILDSAVFGAAEPSVSPYLTAKYALRDETRRAAALFAATLRVNGVAPGAVLPPEGLHVKAGERLLDLSPTPEDVADAVEYLLSAKSVTGTILPVDGGEHLLSEAKA